MSIRKHGRGYQVRLPGDKARTFPTKAAATRYELNRKLARSLGDLHDEEPITVTEMLDGHLHRWQARELPRPSTVRRMGQHAAFLKRELGSVLLNRLRFVDVDDVITARASKHSNAAKKELELLKRALKEARRRGQRFDQELLAVEPIRDQNRIGRALDLDELDQLASWLPEDMSRFVLAGGTIGWRPGEGLGLTDDRLDTDQGSIFIPAAMCKEGRDKTIMLTPGESLLLQEQKLLRAPGARHLFPDRAGKRWPEQWFGEGVWRPACRAAAREWREERNLPAHALAPFDGMVPHDLRHTGISLMARSGMRPEQIAERVGHKDGGALILRRYRHLFPDEMRERLLVFQGFLDQRRDTIAAVAAEGRS